MEPVPAVPAVPAFLRYAQATEHYRLSESTWRRLVRSGQLPCYKLGKRIVLLARADIETHLAKHRQGAA